MSTSNVRLAPRRRRFPENKTTADGLPPPPASVRGPHDLPCDHRGALLGKVNCQCQGQPDIYLCTHPDIASQRCTMHAISRSRKTMKRIDGTIEKMAGPAGFCNFCKHRTAK